MAQYYQIQNLDEIKQIYADVQVVHVASDEVGVSNPNRAQHIVLDDTQQILLQNDGPQQVVYQTQGTPTQYQPPQAGTHYTILGEDINQTHPKLSRIKFSSSNNSKLKRHNTSNNLSSSSRYQCINSITKF
ncbi:hypothetical protein EVAR_72948_1 [Eumeta japonica]|uniref:Uncharacterized protein n=1 Tax=Eumeta variegata TaxID=151549 RepID=A0A4C1TTJ2_EUMVA|nr:hypothetical protein EVAR_72948_1 [Eumeta japonica]